MNFLHVLTLIFITLKLLDKINWSWFWVLSPTVIPVVLVIVTAIGVVISKRG